MVSIKKLVKIQYQGVQQEVAQEAKQEGKNVLDQVNIDCHNSVTVRIQLVVLSEIVKRKQASSAVKLSRGIINLRLQPECASPAKASSSQIHPKKRTASHLPLLTDYKKFSKLN